MRNQKPILLVEDDHVDAMTVKRAFRDIRVSNAIVHLENGEEALRYLRAENQPKPAIILLDLNMPRMNGIEFLDVVKNDLQLRSIPIVVLTTSTEYNDRTESFQYSVAGYMVKPVIYSEFVDMIQTISTYWSNSELPE
ncbi:MAG: response regulator [Bacteroidota bacterium]